MWWRKDALILLLGELLLLLSEKQRIAKSSIKSDNTSDILLALRRNYYSWFTGNSRRVGIKRITIGSREHSKRITTRIILLTRRRDRYFVDGLILWRRIQKVHRGCCTLPLFCFRRIWSNVNVRYTMLDVSVPLFKFCLRFSKISSTIRKPSKGENSCAWYNMCMYCRLHDMAFLTGEEEEIY